MVWLVALNNSFSEEMSENLYSINDNGFREPH